MQFFCKNFSFKETIFLIVSNFYHKRKQFDKRERQPVMVFILPPKLVHIFLEINLMNYKLDD